MRAVPSSFYVQNLKYDIMIIIIIIIVVAFHRRRRILF